MLLEVFIPINVAITLYASYYSFRYAPKKISRLGSLIWPRNDTLRAMAREGLATKNKAPLLLRSDVVEQILPIGAYINAGNLCVVAFLVYLKVTSTSAEPVSVEYILSVASRISLVSIMVVLVFLIYTIWRRVFARLTRVYLTNSLDITDLLTDFSTSAWWLNYTETDESVIAKFGFQKEHKLNFFLGALVFVVDFVFFGTLIFGAWMLYKVIAG